MSIISVIIGAYNEEDNIDRCLENITGQSFRDLEIILINDGSTDRTHEKCLVWTHRDSRIVYVNRKFGGIGPVRTYGISIAKADIIAFSDADDIRSVDSLEKLYQAIVKYDADIAVHDFYRVEYNHNAIVKKEMVKHWLYSESIEENRDLILYADVEVWAKLFKKTLFIDNKIAPLMYNGKAIASDVLAFTPSVLACAKKITHVREPLYYYRIDNMRSATNQFTIAESVLPTIHYLNEGFRSRGQQDRFTNQLRKIAFKYIKNGLHQALHMNHQVTEERYNRLRNTLIQYLRDHYPSESAFWMRKCAVYGSYSLRTTVNETLAEISQMNVHRQFSSVISMVSDKCRLSQVSFTHSNAYRQNMVLNDLSTAISEDAPTDAVYIDFLEERFDIGSNGDHYFTLSDAFIEGASDISYVTIDRYSDLAHALFENACLVLISELKKKYTPSNIYLVKYRLADFFGRYGKEKAFEQKHLIAKANALINECYQFFERHFPGIRIIEITNDTSYFSDEDYRHGCHPYHLNDYIFTKTAEKLEHSFLLSRKEG